MALHRRRGAWLGFVCSALLMVAATGMPARSQEQGTCEAREGFANPQLLAAMRRGVNLPGWDLPDASRRPTHAQLQALRSKGFGHIRLPLDNRRLSGRDRAAYLDEIFEQVILLLSLDYAVSLDLHPDATVGEMFRRDPQEAEGYLAEMWRAVAKRVRPFDPAKVAVELLNEPQTDAETWQAAAGRLIKEIRSILPSTTIIVGPAGPQRHEPLSGMQPFADDNVVYAVHYYDPFAFTHQGADWGGADDPVRHLKDLPFPADASDPTMQDRIGKLKSSGHGGAANMLTQSLETPWTEDAMANAFGMMRGWSVRHSRPVIVNEFGVLSHFAPRQSRLDWLAAVRRQAESHCIGWAHWDFQDGFGLIDPETGMPDEGVMNALVPAGDRDAYPLGRK